MTIARRRLGVFRIEDVMNLHSKGRSWRRPELKKLGLYFVGIDVIGDYLIEVNVTSPTCLQEMNALYDVRLEESVIKFSEKLFDQIKRNNKIPI